MKPLKVIAIILLSFCFAAGFRAGLRRWLPSMYGAIWGQVERPVIALPSPTPVLTGEQKLAREPQPESESDVFATGRVRFRDRVLVQMSDGTVRTDLDNDSGKTRLAKVTSTFADIDGKRYWFKPSTSAPSAKREILASIDVKKQSKDEPPKEIQ